MSNDIYFRVSVLRIDEPTQVQRRQLKDNMCSYIKKHDCWLFEGDWEMGLDNNNNIKCLGEIDVPSIGRWSQKRLAALVEDGLGL